MSYFNKNNQYDKTALAIINAIQRERNPFNWEKYTSTSSTYNGSHILAQPTFSSYGQIGYEVYIYDDNGRHMRTIRWDWERKEMLIDDDYSLEEIEIMDKREELYTKLKSLMKEYQADFSFMKDGNPINVDVFCTVKDVTELVMSDTPEIESDYFTV